MDQKKDRSESSMSGLPTEDVQVKGLLNKIPAALALDNAPVKLPEVQAPSLEGLTAELSPRPITQDDLLERLAELVREQAQRRVRMDGEIVAMGDEVMIDTLGYAQGRLLPFSVRENAWALVNPDPLLPGFFEAMVGRQVGLSVDIALTLPSDYPVEALRGASARFLVDVKEARELALPDPQSAAFIASLGRGATLAEVMRHLGEEIAHERTTEAERDAREQVLDVLVERAKVEVPTALVDEEIRRRWMEAERPILQRKAFEADELQQALDAWLQDPLTRADAARRLKIALVMAAIARRDQIQPRREDLDSIAGLLTGPAKIPREELKRVLQSDPSAQERLANVMIHLATLDHVMSKVKFTAAGTGA
ncbi:peptidylprolyl isomerase [Hyalangium rubrum]|uniref:Peptidylprolyl isomerase n=1 Tax=Hyalangium rubrum TaxID=3103134 RepID=A0ABU5HGD3_9BACT|nr:peptidylprolyl isomerase [Hyalangium sp. s54d21]MDY7232517.1 peptidylprolyl isomerase [Hyalangium sp. s54d21]